MKNRKKLITLLFLLVNNLLIGQKVVDTVYFNRNWEKTSRSNYKYFRVVHKVNSRYEVIDYYKNGRIQMKGTCISLDPEIMDGVCIWYKSNGKIKDSVFYSHYLSDKAELAKQNKLIDDASRYSVDKRNIDSLEKVLKSGKITNPQIYADAYGEKAWLLEHIYKNEIKEYGNGDSSKKEVVDEILSCYKASNDSSGRYKLYYLPHQVGFLEKINVRDELYKRDMKELYAAGYINKSVSALNFGIDYMKGESNWLGGEVSLLNLYGDRWGRVRNDSIVKKYKVPFVWPTTMSLLSVIYMHNFEQSKTDFSFSIFHLVSPFVINITKFGYQKDKKTEIRNWYYRPEIGLGWNFVSIYYSYNFMFDKTVRQSSEKNLLNIKVLLHIFK
ncbi:MAG: hypothetical protein JNL63_00845 [Bacteroidia bacterium]|nr:hypothetical protein [Bacteroidia bacterium]